MRTIQMCSKICGHHMSNSIFTSHYIIYDMVYHSKYWPKNMTCAFPTPLAMRFAGADDLHTCLHCCNLFPDMSMLGFQVIWA